MSNLRRNRGFSLIELVLVVAILVILAGLVLPMLSGVQDNSASVATTSTLQAVRAAIVGSDERCGYLSDMGRLPSTMRDLFVMPTGAAPFDRFTGRGWRGSYLQDATGKYLVNVSLGFSAAYGTNGDPAVLDSWGHPIIIQAPTSAADSKQRDLFTRLVSTGSDGIVQTSPDVLYPSPAQRGDDVILFLMRADVTP